jgi:drug/metabolite transporter (DMT)-like permease
MLLTEGLSGANSAAGAGLAVVVAALWGVAPAVYKRVLARISPASLVVFYSLIVAVFCVVWAWTFRGDLVADFQKMRASDWALITVGAAAAGFLANVLYIYLIEAYDTYWVVGLAYTAPLFAAALAWFWLGERVTPLAGLGLALIAVGALLVVTGRR